MSLIKDFKYGFSAYGQALEFIIKHRLFWIFVIPLLFNIILFSFGYELISQFSTNLITAFETSINQANWDFWGAQFLSDTLGVLIWVLLRLLFFTLFAFWGGYIVLILMSPILSYVSEKTEKIILGTDYPFSWVQLIKDSIRGIRIAIRNFLVELILISLLFVLSFVPVIQLICGPALFIISAYFYGFSFMDYTAERRKLKVRDSINFTKINRGIAVGNGTLFAMSLLIPIIGIGLSSFTSIVSTVAATIAILKKENSHRNLFL